MKSGISTPAATKLALLFVLAVFAVTAQAAEFQREFSFEAKELLVSNMIGRIDVVPGQGEDIVVTVSVQGRDAAEDLLEFVVEEGSQGALAIKFPLDDHTKFIYPELGSHSSTTIHFKDNDESDGSWLRKIFSGWGGKKVTVKGKGNGLELWADVTIEVPARRILEVRHGVGEIVAADLEADLNLDTNSGPISVESLTGDLLADTGSGRVAARGITGEVNIDTGSGSVRVADCTGSEVKVDTGSGSVEVETVDCKYLLVDTGSGGVEARAIKADKAKIDTGSGGVTLQLDRMGDGRFVVDTGSGSIELVLPADASAHITADTGSGSVRNKVSEADVALAERDELDMTVGSGAARVILDAGSGSVTIRQD